jgi:hypothetical protein
MEQPYIPTHWQNLTLEFTEEYKVNRIRKIEKINDINEPPKIMDKAPRRIVNDLKKTPKKYKNINEPILNECYRKKTHCAIL